ncbi:sarcolemmal membrane-associated protein [Drosophila willistoni]|uniref:sarcolemmal membrane-associated protein n=1 Tax=Drosophila willistoni TaxID=7260 RepID=UPI000C26CF07|nr:sarcolemmal membrane-associated protein [Drosophila willistoni]XP_046866903.1 sarcolemmal membrane-associated protein [Drosophila willistoni]
MVLVSNEWRNNKDDEQKSPPSSASSTPPPTAAAAAAETGAATTAATTEGEAPPAGLVGGAAGTVDGAGINKRKKQSNNNNMETNKKQAGGAATATAGEQDKILQILKMDKHELETTTTAPTNDLIMNDDPNENQENNNVEICDSNTNTLQSHNQQQQQQQHQLSSSPDRHATIISTNSTGGSNTPQQLQQQQQVLNMALNSVINGGNSGNGGGVSGDGVGGGGVVVAGGTGVPLFGSLSGLNNGALLQRDSIELQSNQSLTAATDLDIDTSRCSAKGEAKIVLQCEAKSHKFDTRTILLQPNQECKVGRLIAKSKASEGNAIFDCKVLSRNHAMLWYTSDGHFYVKDTKSSNGTFINDTKLGNEPAELHYGDTVKFGVEVIENSRQEVHGCIIARVTLFLPDGREAISIEADQLQLVGPNRISFDEIQRLNSFLQEAAQREKMLKAKLSSLQGVLDSTRKNSAMCWQSMITEDQLLHKINLLEKKLQMMEKNVPENALRNEIVKLLEDKTTYQLTAKEALRKVYQERCDAMQMVSKMEMAYATSENECSILRAQILTSKQNLQDYNTRLEQLQQEYVEYKQDSLRQQQEAKEQEEQRLEHLKEQLGTQEQEMEELRAQLKILQHTIAEHDSEQKLQEQNALEQLDAAITDNMDEGDDDDDDDDNDEGDDDADADDEKSKNIDEKDADTKQLGEKIDELKQKKNKKSKRDNQEKFDIKNKVIRKSAVIKWLKNSDLNKGEGGSDILQAIINSADSGDEENENKEHQPEHVESEASDEFIHNSPKSVRLNGLDNSAVKTHKLESQETLVLDFNNGEELSEDQAIEMLQEECQAYKQKTTLLTNEIHDLQSQMDALKELLALEKQSKSSITSEVVEQEKAVEKEEDKDESNKSQRRQLSGQEDSDCLDDNEACSWKEDLAAIRNSNVEQEEELIVYKERLEQSESSVLLLRNEISQLLLKQQQAGLAEDKQRLMYRILPVGCIVLAAVIYILTSRL